MPEAGMTKVVLNGTDPDGEIWQSGFWLAGLVITGPTDANNVATEIATAASANLSALESFLPPGGKLSGISVYFYLTTSDTATYVGTATVSGITSTASNYGPLQICCVVTLNTAFAGRRYRGRMYFPAGGAAFVTGCYINSAGITALVNAVGSFFNAVMNATGGVVSVYSTVGAMSHPVTSIKADNRADIQRRRANHQSATVVATAAVGA